MAGTLMADEAYPWLADFATAAAGEGFAIGGCCFFPRLLRFSPAMALWSFSKEKAVYLASHLHD